MDHIELKYKNKKIRINHIECFVDIIKNPSGTVKDYIDFIAYCINYLDKEFYFSS